MKIKHIILLFTVFPFLLFCKSIDKKGLTNKGKYQFKNEFRMDGYYLRSSDTTDYFYYFFQNGLCYGNGLPNSYNPQSTECPEIFQGLRNISYFWGSFNTINDSIHIQFFFPFDIFTVGVVEYYGLIKNDTTLLLQKKKFRKKEFAVNETFQFNRCANKPDSTNIIMTW